MLFDTFGAGAFWYQIHGMRRFNILAAAKHWKWQAQGFKSVKPGPVFVRFTMVRDMASGDSKVRYGSNFAQSERRERHASASFEGNAYGKSYPKDELERELGFCSNPVCGLLS